MITDEESIFGIGLRVLLTTQPDLAVVSSPVNGNGIMEMVAELSPDLLITDIPMHDSTGIDEIANIKQSYPQTKILLVTQHKSEQSIRTALWAGASGYVLKDASNTELLTAVRTVLDGKVYLSPSLSDNIINAFLLGTRPLNAKSHLESLTKREREILKMVAEGHTNRYMATQLCLSIKTVEKHRSNLMKKLDLHNVSALISFAIGHGLIGNSE